MCINLMCSKVMMCSLLIISTLHAAVSTLNYNTKVAVIGSGNWGTAVARRVALNIKEYDLVSNKDVNMWVYEEKINGRLLSDIINEDHENPKYLANVQLPENVVALSDLVKTCADADILLFVVPHQFLPSVLSSLKNNVKKSAIAVSLIKGIQFTSEGPALLSELIKDELQLHATAAVMGANVASDVASDAFVEATVSSIDISVAKTVADLFRSPQFQTEISTDQSTVELCGALKNVIAIGAGLCDGMKLGVSSKAALIRQGTKEMALFCKLFDRTGNYKVCRELLPFLTATDSLFTQPETMMLSCGIADIVATCFGGRNRRCGKAFAEKVQAGAPQAAATDGLWNTIEAELLGGQKLQGVETCREAMHCLRATGHVPTADEENRRTQFPLFRRIYGIACEGVGLDTLFRWEDC